MLKKRVLVFFHVLTSPNHFFLFGWTPKVVFLFHLLLFTLKERTYATARAGKIALFCKTG